MPHDEALACFAQALRLRPDYPEAHWHQTLTWLHQGDLVRGWPEYEWRWKRKRARPRLFPEPLWDGSNLKAKQFSLWCEQGLGDSLQFIRYAPLVKARGGNVLVECPDKLMAMFFTAAGIDQIVPQDTPSLPPFDVQVPLMSLPGIFGTRLHTIPSQVPYLSCRKTSTTKWRQEFAAAARNYESDYSASASSGKATPSIAGPPPLLSLRLFSALGPSCQACSSSVCKRGRRRRVAHFVSRYGSST